MKKEAPNRDEIFESLIFFKKRYVNTPITKMRKRKKMSCKYGPGRRFKNIFNGLNISELRFPTSGIPNPSYEFHDGKPPLFKIFLTTYGAGSFTNALPAISKLKGRIFSTYGEEFKLESVRKGEVDNVFPPKITS